MVKPTAQACHALTTYFKTAFKEVVGREPVVSRNKARWWFESILMDYKSDQARELIDFYLSHYDNPDLEWFAYNYDKVDTNMQERMRAEDVARKRREETEKRLEEWRNRWKKSQD